MDLNYSAEELAFRDEVRSWLRANLPQDLRDKVENYAHLSKDDLMRWHRILAKRGWVAPAWPKEWGGTGWNVVQRYIFDEELGFAGAPRSFRSASPCALRSSCVSAATRRNSASCRASTTATTSGARATRSRARAAILRR